MLPLKNPDVIKEANHAPMRWQQEVGLMRRGRPRARSKKGFSEKPFLSLTISRHDAATAFEAAAAAT